MTVEQFLRGKGILSEDSSEFIIKYQDGTEVSVNTLCKEFATLKLLESASENEIDNSEITNPIHLHLNGTSSPDEQGRANLFTKSFRKSQNVGDVAEYLSQSVEKGLDLNTISITIK